MSNNESMIGLLLEKPLVSVICETYKNFEYVYKTLASILIQDYPNIELILADDGSENFPQDEIEKYIDVNKKENIIDVIILHSDINRGTVKNTNNAYRNSHGKYLIPIAGDDEFYSSSVVTQIVKTFEENHYDFFIASRACIDRDDNLLGVVPSNFGKKMISRLDTREKQYKAAIIGEFYDALTGSVTYFSKEFLEKWGYYDEKYFLFEDLPFFSEYLRDNCIAFDFDIIAIKYRTGGVSDISNPHPAFLEDEKLFQTSDMIKCINDYGKFFKNKVYYTIDRYWMKDVFLRIKLYVRHPFIFLSNVLYQIKYKLFSKI